MFKSLINLILNFIYPKRCIFCDEVVPINYEDEICKYCYTDINFVVEDEENNISLFFYDDVTRFSIHRLKYYNKRNYAKVFAKMMYNKLLKFDYEKFDYIIYVPMYEKKKKKRGYDQAELIAFEFSKISGIKLENNNLIRTKNTLPQSKVSFEERKSNVSDCFCLVNKDKIKEKNILLIDDIYTTGSTIKSCSKILEEAGAKSVCFYTLAKVKYKNNISNDFLIEE